MSLSNEHVETGAPRRDPEELRKLILKLRWIGQEREADRLCRVLSRTASGKTCIELPLVTD